MGLHRGIVDNEQIGMGHLNGSANVDFRICTTQFFRCGTGTCLNHECAVLFRSEAIECVLNRRTSMPRAASVGISEMKQRVCAPLLRGVE